MADKALQSTIQIDGVDYEVTAAVAEKVKNSLTINVYKDGEKTQHIFDGSADIEVDVNGGIADSAKKAKEIQVHLDDDVERYATITISTNEPTDGEIGDIWFKCKEEDL